MSNTSVNRVSVLKTQNMKNFIAVSVVVLVACVASAEMPARASVPAPVYADGEASVKITLPAPAPDKRILKITMAFDAAPTNNVEFALTSGDSEEVIIGWDCGEWFARGGQLLEGWVTTPASNPSATGPRTLTLAVRFGKKNNMPLTFALDADGVPVGFAGPDSLLGWLARLGEHGQPLQVAVTSRGGAGGAGLDAAFSKDGSLIIVR